MGGMKFLSVLFFTLSTGFLLSAQDSPGLPPALGEYAAYLGMGIAEALEAFGPPDHLYSYAAEEDAAGSVVFHYAEGVSLFWADDRVWQVRLAPEFRDPSRPRLIGLSLEEILREWGPPLLREEALLLYEIPREEYPLRCALYLDEERTAADLYLFRSDY